MGVELGKVLAKTILAQLETPGDVKGQAPCVFFLPTFCGHPYELHRRRGSFITTKSTERSDVRSKQARKKGGGQAIITTMNVERKFQNVLRQENPNVCYYNNDCFCNKPARNVLFKEVVVLYKFILLSSFT